jgi:hypothetical protein
MNKILCERTRLRQLISARKQIPRAVAKNSLNGAAGLWVFKSAGCSQEGREKARFDKARAPKEGSCAAQEWQGS